MFEMICRWLGIGSPRKPEPKNTSPHRPVAASVQPVPAEIPAADAGAKHSFVCREAMLNREEGIDGYAFALSHKLQSRTLEKGALIQRVYDDAMLRNLAPLGVSTLLGQRLSFIHLSPASLKTPLLEAFSKLNAVVMINPGALAATDLPEICITLQRLREIGIKYGWTLNQLHPEMTEFLTGADFIEIDSKVFDGVQLETMYREFRAASKHPKLIAGELQTSDEFTFCHRCGFDYFMGPFASNRENWRPAKSEINRLRVIEVLNMIRAGAEFDAISDCLRTEPVLTFKLLRYINSPGVGLQKKIGEISQALLVLGRERFHRWLSLMLFDFNRHGYHESVLNEQVLARARFMEMLAGQVRVPAEADQLFMTGLFSMLDVMMDQPLADVLKQVSLPEAVTAALKGKPGSMRDALLLAIAVESGNTDEMAAAAAQCGLDAKIVTSVMVEALTWAQQASAAAS